MEAEGDCYPADGGDREFLLGGFALSVAPEEIHAGAQIKVAGTLSFDKVYAVDRTMPLGRHKGETPFTLATLD